MDICTLTLVTTLVCTVPPPAHCEVQGDRKYCEMQPTCGPAPDPYYDCVKPDGTHYQAPLIDHPAFILNH